MSGEEIKAQLNKIGRIRHRYNFPYLIKHEEIFLLRLINNMGERRTMRQLNRDIHALSVDTLERLYARWILEDKQEVRYP